MLLSPKVGRGGCNGLGWPGKAVSEPLHVAAVAAPSWRRIPQKGGIAVSNISPCEQKKLSYFLNLYFYKE
jgi:hypothetical protein